MRLIKDINIIYRFDGNLIIFDKEFKIHYEKITKQTNDFIEAILNAIPEANPNIKPDNKFSTVKCFKKILNGKTSDIPLDECVVRYRIHDTFDVYVHVNEPDNYVYVINDDDVYVGKCGFDKNHRLMNMNMSNEITIDGGAIIIICSPDQTMIFYTDFWEIMDKLFKKN